MPVSELLDSARSNLHYRVSYRAACSAQLRPQIPHFKDYGNPGFLLHLDCRKSNGVLIAKTTSLSTG